MPFVLALQELPLEQARQIMLVNVLLVLLIVGFAATIVVILMRRSMRQRMEAERLAAMGTATARILHQVKNPLQSVLLHAEILADEEMIKDATLRRDTCAAVVDGARRISELLEDLSAYASGVGRRLELEPLALHELVSDAARTAAREAEQRGVAFTIGSVDEARVRADAYFLRQALENVLRNAREAVEGMDADRAPVLEVRLERRDGEAVVVVRDNGPGIPPEELETILQPFVTTKGTGMGLGLPICRDIVEGHGGRLEIDSRVGRGTTVSFILPLAPAGESLQTA